MVKGTRIGPLWAGSGFLLGSAAQPTPKEVIMKTTKIIAYRRRCRRMGTGLSHYIMLTPKNDPTKKDKKR